MPRGLALFCLAILPPRPSLTKNQASAAMCVQPNAVTGKAIQYMVLYCLTPPISPLQLLKICARPPSPGRSCADLHLFEGGVSSGNIPVKIAASSRTGNRPLLTSHYPSQGVHVA